jgi:hypothetical protein
LARPIATSLSQKNDGCGLGLVEVRKDISLVDGDATSREEAAVFGLRDERTHDKYASRVGGDGVIDGYRYFYEGGLVGFPGRYYMYGV